MHKAGTTRAATPMATRGAAGPTLTGTTPEAIQMAGRGAAGPTRTVIIPAPTPMAIAGADGPIQIEFNYMPTLDIGRIVTNPELDEAQEVYDQLPPEAVDHLIDAFVSSRWPWSASWHVRWSRSQGPEFDQKMTRQARIDEFIKGDWRGGWMRDCAPSKETCKMSSNLGQSLLQMSLGRYENENQGSRESTPVRSCGPRINSSHSLTA
jgi:hypothetical protein